MPAQVQGLARAGISAAVTVNGLFIAHVLTWHEIVRALSDEDSAERAPLVA